MFELYIHWSVNPEIISIGGYSLRYYSLLFVLGLVLSSWVMGKMISCEGVSEDNYTSLVIYGLVGLVAGARLGHCLFYEPSYFLSHPLEMILPIQFLPQGGWQFIGYQGLASHGGAIGLIVAMFLFTKQKKLSFIGIVDMVAIVAPLAGAFIRLANLMNSEIIGVETTVPWAFIFHNVDTLPRHPTQLYEAFCYLLIFAINYRIYSRYGNKLRKGFFFGFSALLIFVVRFSIEFLKEVQVNFESQMWLNMGQWLSIPFIIMGICLVCYGLRKPVR